jgi:uncharacterized protein (TIGR03663 family)
MTRAPALILLAGLAIIVLAGALRFPRLSERPFHGDEAVNAVKFQRLWEQGEYLYDPHEFHGPALPYVTLPVVSAAAEDFRHSAEGDYRLVTALAGIVLVALTLAAGPGIGWVAAVAAALLVALSTAMVYFSRYYIHEVLLVVFTWGAILCGWRYALRPGVGWAIGGGALLALMHATKETAVLAWAAMFAAIVTVVLFDTRAARQAWYTYLKPRSLVGAATAFLAVYVVLFSSFFTNWSGVVDGIRTYFAYLDRGTGGEPLHVHSWHWYFDLLLFHRVVPRAPWFSEALIIVLAVFGLLVAVISPTRPLVRFIALYTVALTIFYSVIPYKTPWCVLSFLHGMCVLAGVGAAALVCWPPMRVGRAIAAILLLAAAGHLGYQAWLANFRLHTHWSNPWVYAHPLGSVREIGERIEALAAVHPDGPGMHVRIFDEQNLWPVYFYLRGLQNVGHLTSLPRDAQAPVLIVSAARADQVTEQFGDRYTGPHVFGVRTDVQVAMFVHRELWQKFMKERRSEPPAR